MTIGECIRRVDALRPNAISEDEKALWALELDLQLEHEFYPRYEREGRHGPGYHRKGHERTEGIHDHDHGHGNGHGHGNDHGHKEAETPKTYQAIRDHVLSGSGPYEAMYVYYVAAKVDFAQQEMETYTLDNATYQEAMDDYRKDYNRTHTHKSARLKTDF